MLDKRAKSQTEKFSQQFGITVEPIYIYLFIDLFTYFLFIYLFIYSLIYSWFI
jgi:hypothetical protein